MAKGNGKSLLLAGLAAGAYAYFSKQENREKAIDAFTSMKTKVNSFVDSQKEKMEMKEKGHPDPYDTADNKMVNEGAMTSVNYYNEEIQESDEDTGTNRTSGTETN